MEFSSFARQDGLSAIVFENHARGKARKGRCLTIPGSDWKIQL